VVEKVGKGKHSIWSSARKGFNQRGDLLSGREVLQLKFCGFDLRKLEIDVVYCGLDHLLNRKDVEGQIIGFAPTV
jgi:hypothetical protein